jgi:hypothetical protein
MVKSGDDKIFLGEKPKSEEEFYFESKKLKNIQEKYLNDQRDNFSIFSCPEGIFRNHKTIVELDIDKDINYDYLINDKKIKEIIIS